MVQQYIRRFVVACLFGMVALCLSVGIALAADQSSEASNTKVYTGSVQLLSRGLNGAVSNDDSGGGYISTSGSCLVFSSQASNLVGGDTNGVGDMFYAPIINGVVGKLEILIPGTTRSFPRGISDDCATILFMRDDPGNLTNLYLLDRPSGTVTLVSRGTDGTGVGKVDSEYMTPNGQFVYFTSTSDKIIFPDTNGTTLDAFEFEVSTGSIFLVSRTSDGQQVSGVPSAYYSTYPVRGSDDGNLAFFVATDHKLPDPGSYGNEEIYVFNRAAGQTTSLTAGLPEHLGTGNNNYDVNYGEMMVTDGKVFFAGNKYYLYRYDILSGARDELPKFRTFNTWHVSRDGYTLAFNYGSLGSSYSCLQNVLTSASECLHEPLYDSQYVLKEILSLSGDGTKILFGAQNLGWVNIPNNRAVYEQYYWDRTADYSISGTVTDQSGKPAGGTMKYVGGPFPEVRSVTFSGGVYTITNLITGTYTITPVVSGKTFNPPSQTVNVPATKKANFPPSSKDQVSVVVFIPGMAGSNLLRSSDKKYLWLVWSDNTKMELSLKPPAETHPEIYTGDVVRCYNFYDGCEFHTPKIYRDVYGSFLEAMTKSQHYIEYQTGGNPKKRREADCDDTQKDATLFIFPWDWRYGIADGVNPHISLSPNNVELLHEFVMCILKIYQGKDVEITVVAHSMGGLLTTEYLLKYPSRTEHHIKQVISVGTPYLGAPKAVASLLAGEFESSIISPDTAMTLLEYFPGAHQLLPSKKYFELAGSPLSIPENLYVNGDGNKLVVYADFQRVLQDYYRSPKEGENYRTAMNFVANNEVVFNNTAFTNWTADTFGIDYHILYAEEQEAATIGKVLEKSLKYTSTGGVIQKSSSYEYKYTKGDETVPVISSSRKANGQDLNGGAHLYHFAQKDKENVEHMQLLSNPRVQNCVLYILGKSTTACKNDPASVYSSSTQDAAKARYLSLWGVSSLSISDGISTTDNLITSTISLEALFPDVTLNYMSDSAVSIIMPVDSSYTVYFTSADHLQVEATVGDGVTPDTLIRYTDVPVAEGKNLEIGSSQEKPADMLIDTNGDTIPETPVKPSSTLAGDQARDTIPPTVTIGFDAQTNSVSITATDDTSGISRIFYSTNGTDYMSYTASFSVKVGKTSIYAQAEDRVGNLSSIVVREVVVNDTAQPEPSYSLYLPLVKR